MLPIRNLAAVQLRLEDFQNCVVSCNAALEHSSEDDKALYRRASALLKLGKLARAQEDIKRLAAVRGESDAVVRRLREEAGGQSTTEPDT